MYLSNEGMPGGLDAAVLQRRHEEYEKASQTLMTQRGKQGDNTTESFVRDLSTEMQRLAKQCKAQEEAIEALQIVCNTLAKHCGQHFGFVIPKLPAAVSDLRELQPHIISLDDPVSNDLAKHSLAANQLEPQTRAAAKASSLSPQLQPQSAPQKQVSAASSSVSQLGNKPGPDFFKADHFTGLRHGYFFGNGSGGLGYYNNPQDIIAVQNRSGSPQLDESNKERHFMEHLDRLVSLNDQLSLSLGDVKDRAKEADARIDNIDGNLGKLTTRVQTIEKATGVRFASLSNRGGDSTQQ